MAASVEQISSQTRKGSLVQITFSRHGEVTIDFQPPMKTSCTPEHYSAMLSKLKQPV